ncbi:MAG TPA: ABC transporter substrate-binding protein [Candidatus Acidoferrales bacterium]|nr:ABC transporter substrate-binding protein [Candidatus Acidoferrales bacterium]
MKRIASRYLAAASFLAALIVFAMAASGARRPRYGGTLNIDLQGRVTSLDPTRKQATVADGTVQEHLLELIADRLVALDRFGRPQPSLAISWRHNDKFTRWKFQLRPNVRFWNATPLTPDAVVASLQAISPSWRVSAANDSVIVESDSPLPNLLYVLAEARNSILLRESGGDIVGTGPFRLVSWETRRHAMFAANDDYWGRRPFADTIDVQMGRTVRERMIDLDLGKTDIADVAPDRARIDAAHGIRISASDPDELLALVFARSSARTKDIRIRQALSLAIDRASLVDFVLQKEGEPAGALLPQWSSGYEFLFSTTADTATARQLASQIPLRPALKLGYDFGDPIERMIAERIVVNAQAAGISIFARPIVDNTTNSSANGAANAAEYDARILRVPMASPAPGVALEALLQTLAPLADLDTSLAAPLEDSTNSERMYARECAVVGTYEIIPLVHVPEVVGLSARVRDWVPARWGAWRLADVWLDGASQ